jgi:hypothetical protein
MADTDFSSRYDEWTEGEDLSFTSPPWREDQHEQILVFASRTKDGSIEAKITPVEGGKDRTGNGSKEACLLIRYMPPEQGYCVGFGGFGTKWFIARMNPNSWQVLASIGRNSSIEYGKTYRLKVEFVGSQINLYENGVPLLSAIDESYSSGQFGLRTQKTDARFANVKIGVTEPVCFVVMPFSSELAFVYSTIQATLKGLGLQCVRGDVRAVSRPVIDDIREDIARADLVIVDFSGRNPNVYYEAGLADAWKKKWIVIAQAPDDLAFDVKHIRTIFYSDRMGADVKFREDLERAIHETLLVGPPKPE